MTAKLKTLNSKALVSFITTENLFTRDSLGMATMKDGVLCKIMLDNLDKASMMDLEFTKISKLRTKKQLLFITRDTSLTENILGMAFKSKAEEFLFKI